MALLTVASLAHAQGPEDDTARARVHFNAGKAYYYLRQFSDALREFEAGYSLAPRARFLLNIGHCYRNLSQFDRARDAYRKFLAGVDENDPDRTEARQRLAEVEAAIAKQQTPPAPTLTAPPLSRAATPEAAAARPTAPAAAVTTSTPTARKHSKLRHLGWAIPLGVVVVVGVALGVYFGTRSSSCQGSTLACIPAMP